MASRASASCLALLLALLVLPPATPAHAGSGTGGDCTDAVLSTVFAGHLAERLRTPAAQVVEARGGTRFSAATDADRLVLDFYAADGAHLAKVVGPGEGVVPLGAARVAVCPQSTVGAAGAPLAHVVDPDAAWTYVDGA